MIVVVFVIFVAHQLLGALGPPWSEDGGRKYGKAREHCGSALQQVVASLLQIRKSLKKPFS